jgi:D-ribose pyranose/furanose isomerase RbsD
MLKGSLIHPEILRVLGAAGHGSQVLIADSNYPFSTGAHPDAARVYLNLTPGKLTVLDVLTPGQNPLSLRNIASGCRGSKLASWGASHSMKRRAHVIPRW